MRFALLAKDDKVKVEIDPDRFKGTLQEELDNNGGDADKAIEKLKKELLRRALHK